MFVCTAARSVGVSSSAPMLAHMRFDASMLMKRSQSLAWLLGMVLRMLCVVEVFRLYIFTFVYVFSLCMCVFSVVCVCVCVCVVLTHEIPVRARLNVCFYA